MDTRLVEVDYGALRFSRLFLQNPCSARYFHNHEVSNLRVLSRELEFWRWSGHTLMRLQALEEVVVSSLLQI